MLHPTGLNISLSSTTRGNSVNPSDFPTTILNTFFTSSMFARQPVSSVPHDYTTNNIRQNVDSKNFLSYSFLQVSYFLSAAVRSSIVASSSLSDCTKPFFIVTDQISNQYNSHKIIVLSVQSLIFRHKT